MGEASVAGLGPAVVVLQEADEEAHYVRLVDVPVVGAGQCLELGESNFGLPDKYEQILHSYVYLQIYMYDNFI